MARREACATILEDIVLQMQTIMEGDIDAAVSAVGEDKVVVLLFVLAVLVTSAVTERDGCVRLRSQIIAGKSTRQDTMLIVIRFMTNLEWIYHI